MDYLYSGPEPYQLRNWGDEAEAGMVHDAAWENLFFEWLTRLEIIGECRGLSAQTWIWQAIAATRGSEAFWVHIKIGSIVDEIVAVTGLGAHTERSDIPRTYSGVVCMPRIDLPRSPPPFPPYSPS